MKLERSKFTNCWNCRIPNTEYRIFEHRYWNSKRYSVQVVFWIQRTLFEKQVQVRWIKTLEYAKELAEKIETQDFNLETDSKHFLDPDKLRW